MSSEQDHKCVFCNETFRQKEELQIHFRKHADPNFNQKKIKGHSQDERDVSEKPKEQVGLVECDVCAEIFTTISKAITHKHKVHPDHDTKYFCPWCGKLFTMKHLYNKHMLASHANVEKSSSECFHCDSCDVDFNVPAAIAYHNKFYHRQEELPTIGHSKKLKMILQEVVQIFYCPFCGEEFDNKVNLHKHMSDDHSDENQSPDDVFRCPLCDAIFYHLDAYELHLTYHSIEDLYTERNELMNEITDFSLETVQPLQEKVENAEPLNDDEPRTIGIEEFLELSMDDPADNRKSKKHKKHKKSKKAAITLDEFLNMNKDVFGEGIDFQGIEEVPTQAVAKRLKAKKSVPTSKIMSSDIAKLKRQGIVVKKQPIKTGKPVIIKKGISKSAIKMQKNTNSASQTQNNSIASTDDVLSKLLNQGSQIKIVKRPNQDSEEHSQQENENIAQKRLSLNNTENNHSEGSKQVLDDSYEKDDKNNEESRENEKATDLKCDNVKNMPHSIPNKTSAKLESISTNNDIDSETLQNSNENSNNFKTKDEIQTRSESTIGIVESLSTARNNSNDPIKSYKNIPETTDKSHEDNKDYAIDKKPTEEFNSQVAQENKMLSDAASEKSSLDALKRLSHLITIKPVNQSANPTLSEEKKPENGLHVECKTSNILQNYSPKTRETNLSNLKNLSGITIKSRVQPCFNTSKSQSVQGKEDSVDEYHKTDDEGNEEKSTESKMNVGQLLKSPQLSVQTKHSLKMVQKESPKVPSNNEDSQSSGDLLKNLQSVIAKPVNTNTQKIQSPTSSPNSPKSAKHSKASMQKEITEEGIEIFSIDDSDSDETNCDKTNNYINRSTNEKKREINKSIDVLRNMNKNITVKSTNQQCKTINTDAGKLEKKKFIDEDDDWGDDFDEQDNNVNLPNKLGSPKPISKHIIINNVLKNLSKNITVKSRTSSPSQSQDHNSKDSHLETNDADSDSDTPSSRVKIKEIENTGHNDFTEEPLETTMLHENVKIEHPDDSHSDHDDGPIDEECDDISDVESQISSTTVQKVSENSVRKSSFNNLNKLGKDLTIKGPNNKLINSILENPVSEEIPVFAKNLSKQISIKHLKKPDSCIMKQTEETATHAMNQSNINKKLACSSNQVNTFNKEVKTVKTFQTQSKTIIQEITTTVTKTIKTVNQTKQEVRNVGQSSSGAIIPQKIQGMNTNFSQKNFQNVKVRQSAPNVRTKVRGPAPRLVRTAICAPVQPTRPAIFTPVRASNALVPVRPALNRLCGPRPRMPNVRASVSGQQRPQIGTPVKVSPGAVFTSPKRPAEATGPFSCFKKPKESLIPVPEYQISKNDGELSVKFSSSMHMSKSNFSSTTKTVKANSVLTSTQMKSETSGSSQQLSKLRNMSGLSVVKTSQAKQTQVEEKIEISASKRNTLEAIQKLQSQGLLVKKPRLDESNDSDHSQPSGDDMEHATDEEFDE